ncbi:MAG: D-alanyl-D-alanine carboxypeptidase, partial [Calditerricola sp.]|nr:D-alanyl-D-alanine carboxypeptidase [Calditerricola sp.]
LKTGHTEQAGYCFTGTAQRDGMRLISVVMGTSSELARFQETAKLFDYGFSQFEVKTLFKGKEPVKGYETVPVTKGVDLEVPVVPERDVVAVVRKGDESAPSPRVSVAEVVAPVKQGQAVGTIKAVAASGGDEYLTPEAGAVKLIAQEDVEEAGWLRLFFRSAKNALAGLFSNIVEAVTGAF